MARQLLTIEVDRVPARHALLRLTGELDFDTAPELVRTADQVRAEGYDDLIVDLAGVSLCDSSGLSAFVRMYRAGARPVRLTGLPYQLRQLLARTGLAELLTADQPGTDQPDTDRAGLPGADRAGLPGADRAGLPGADRVGLSGADRAGLPGAGPADADEAREVG